MNIENQPVWKTNDYWIASYLMAKGLKVLGCEGEMPRKEFVFLDLDPVARKALIFEFQMGNNDMVSANALIESQRRLQRLIRY